MDKNKKFVITMHRELGSGGRAVGQKLAARLGVPFYDKTLIGNYVEQTGFTVEQALKGFADRESCVIAERSAFFLLKGYPNHLHVLIQASLSYRVNRLMEHRGLTRVEAEKLIKQYSRECHYFDATRGKSVRFDSSNFDLVISMDGKTEDEAVAMIYRFL